jgi:hypothetical protein
MGMDSLEGSVRNESSCQSDRAVLCHLRPSRSYHNPEQQCHITSRPSARHIHKPRNLNPQNELAKHSQINSRCFNKKKLLPSSGKKRKEKKDRNYEETGQSAKREAIPANRT